MLLYNNDIVMLLRSRTNQARAYYGCQPKALARPLALPGPFVRRIGRQVLPDTLRVCLVPSVKTLC